MQVLWSTFFLRAGVNSANTNDKNGDVLLQQLHQYARDLSDEEGKTETMALLRRRSRTIKFEIRSKTRYRPDSNVDTTVMFQQARVPHEEEEVRTPLIAIARQEDNA